ncbi:hypothetical protein ACU8NH_06040 [Rhizobium leguminosarum]|jgi:hypothetical protein|uniref:Uncharacterized protein n=1 Tax=Rhizobium leguminosarum TaxID=384 RepID=A0A444ICX8_RHILE|nr:MULTISPECIES: hypothetical protein [Rhizobium]MDH6659465.1 hypothetical protein [Rhizobium sophorae]ASS53710.1 hypothetical protein CHR56_03475 [Rhizobium leguminosarum bv. viciae]MBA8834510.1 hypothetical protein [Rhizobium leguminosarum]MBA9036080.1 hypothetical protein [Rhizobium leguminosarum]MBB4327485.1 hypothetical protein [Rhizobium leguminosarum]
MTSIPGIEVEADRAKPSNLRVIEQRGSKSSLLVGLLLMLLPVNAGVLIYTAKNSADVRESRETIAALKRSIDGLRGQMEKQSGNIADNAKADEVALIRQGMDELQKTMMNERRNDTSGLRMGSALVLSAPGKEPAQFFAPRAVPAEAQASDSSLASLEAGGIAVSDLPRYERTLSPEGQLILRKAR